MSHPTASLRLNDRGDAVAKLHRSLEGLALTVDPAERAARVFGPRTQALVQDFQARNALSSSGEADGPTQDLMRSHLRKASPFTVSGKLLGRDGKPIVGATVFAVDIDLRCNEPLGDDTTDESGAFKIRYAREDFANHEKATADLVLRAVIKDERVAQSKVLFNAPEITVIDLQADSAPGQTSEFERLMAAISPSLRGVPLSELTKTDEELGSDIDFVAGDTGEDRQNIVWLVQAATLARDSSESPPTAEAAPSKNLHHAGQGPGREGLPTEVFYGWFRLGLSTEEGALWAESTEKLVSSFRSAVDQGIVPARTREYQEGVIAQIRQAKLDLLLALAGPETEGSLGDLLGTMQGPLRREQQRAIAAMMTTLRPEAGDFVQRIAAIPDFDGDAKAVARTLRLGALTMGHVPLARELQGRLTLAEENEGSLRPLAELSRDRWIDLAYAHGVPAGTEPVAYASALAGRMEREQPTAALAAHLTGDRRLGKQPLLSEVGAFLRDNPTFDIATANLNTLRGRAELGGVNDPKELVEGLRVLQRMHGLEATWDETAALLENGFDSPDRLLAAGPTQLTEILDGRLSADRVRELHDGAEELFETTMGVYTAVLSPFSGPNVMPFPDGPAPPQPPPRPGDPEVTPGEILVPVKVKPDLNRIPRIEEPAVPVVIPGDRTFWPDGEEIIDREPTLRALFGPQDACACGHCNSVLSPAAYFVDVMQFIRDAGRLDRLLGRRPDLQDLELSCANATTEVPAIDLALEILENAVAFPYDEKKLAFSLDVELPAGTTIEEELGGATLGPAIRAALGRTVRKLPETITAAPAGQTMVGMDWTVTDGRRRWTLSVQNKTLRARTEGGTTRRLDATNLDDTAIRAALDQGDVATGAEAAFAMLFAPGLVPAPDLDNYAYTIKPVVAGRSWEVAYRSVAHLLVDVRNQQLELQTTNGVVWSRNAYHENTVSAVAADLASGLVPELIRELLSPRFVATKGGLTVKRRGAGAWVISSARRTLAVSHSPGGVSISSLAYQSGEAGADTIGGPENHNPAAYAKLKGEDAIFPWSLPVDLPLEQVRLFLERGRSSRERLAALMVPTNQRPDQSAPLVLEAMGLSVAEADLIAPQAPWTDADLYRQWGLSVSRKRVWDAALGCDFEASGPLGLLANVSVLLQQSQLSFEQLGTVLATRFVCPTGTTPLQIEPPGTCVPSEMRLLGLTTGHLDRIHRFVRLQRRLGWSAEELDRAIGIAAPGGALDIAALQSLAHLVALREHLDLPVAEILSWWNGSATPSEQSRRLRGLARALNTTPTELEHARVLFAMADPFARPLELRTFCERVSAAGRSEISFEDLRYLLRHEPTPGSDIELEATERAALSLAAREAVQSIPDVDRATTPLDGADGGTGTLAAEAVIAALATRLRTARELVEDLLRARLRHPSQPTRAALDVFLEPAFFTPSPSQAAKDAAESVLVRLHKAVFVCDALGFGAMDLAWLRTPTAPSPAAGFIALDFDSLPAKSGVTASVATSLVSGFERLLALRGLRESAPRSGDFLRKYATLRFDDPAYAHNAQVVVAVALGLDGFAAPADQVKQAAAQLQISTADQYRDPIAFGRLIELLITLKQLGATVADADSLTAPSPSDAAALKARQLLRDKYDEASWHELVKPIADTLRERQRDVLLAYLIGQDNTRDDGPPIPHILPRPHLRGIDDLYERYLIDVQTSSCLKTTRLLHGTAALQLFVQRSLLNLEGRPPMGDDKRKLWEWMHRYRVWEANRKVFLFPENWLLPELRDDKTAIFRQMEGTLTEREPSPESSRAALLGYLEDLGELAQISTIAMYEDPQPPRKDQHGKLVDDRTLYVLGRTPNQPYRYFWRSAKHFGDADMSWSGWEALDLDNANDFIMPFVLNGDLHVAWPNIRPTLDEKKVGNAQFEWEVQLAWIRRTSDGWSKREVGAETLTVNRLATKTLQNSFSFRLRPHGPAPSASEIAASEAVYIDCYAATTQVPDPPSGSPDPEGAILTATGNSTGHHVNTFMDVKCHCWGKFTLPGETQARHEKISDVTLRLEYPFGYWGGNFDLVKFELPTHGLVTFVNGLAVQNSREVTATFWRKRADGSRDTKPAIVRKLEKSGKEFDRWLLEYTVIFDIGKSLKGDFDPDRPVVYQHAGEFALDVLQDLTVRPKISSQILATLFSGASLNGKQLEGKVQGNGFLFEAITDELPLPPQSSTALEQHAAGKLTITAAAGRAGADRMVLYLRDASSRCYLDVGPNRLVSWPDGHEFVGWYRRLGATATATLFSPETQGQTRHGQKVQLTPGVLRTTRQEISFLRAEPYANYNWEVFLHAPLAIADYFAGHKHFAAARQWLHAVFDPTADLSLTLQPRFWRFLPFHEAAKPQAIAAALGWLANPTSAPTEFERGLAAQITAWKEDPFMPHVIARLRPSAYQWYAFFAYLDLLIGWGDELFRRDTRESVNEAALLYVLAGKLLGGRPRKITPTSTMPPQTYRSLPKDKNGDLAGFSNAWVTYAAMPGTKKLLKQSRQASSAAVSGVRLTAETTHVRGTRALASLGSLAFCIPQNERITEFHDLIERRLFDVRHCRNIDGISRDLPLFEPPIDPLLLIRAKAAGLDINGVIAGSYAPPLPHYRFAFTLQKAVELAGELRSLGGALLSALEKKDAEELTLLRSRHEVAMLKLVRETRQQQIDEAEANIVALHQSEDTVRERFGQYQKLLGKIGITNGQDGLPVVEQSSSLAVATDADGEASGLGLSRKEVDQLRLGSEANAFTQIANSAHVLAGVFSIIPNTWGGNALVAGSTFGGQNLGSAASAVAKALEMAAANANYFAGKLGTLGSYERRQDEWVHQSKMALAELKQLQKQGLAATIRKEIATLELRNHDKQVENAQKVDDFMRSKFTNQQLYRWMSSQISEVYFRTYQLALDQARRAERAYRHELALDSKAPTVVQAAYWDSTKKGLMAGEHLYHDLKRMEVAYLAQNRREYEITKHVSVMQLDPGALITLRETGTGEVEIPAALYDMDFAGHVLRRLKSVSITVPCVSGAYGGVSCTLTLLESRTSDSDGIYKLDALGPQQSIVTSTAQNDGGLFETSLRDERYLPFEGAGAVSKWRIALPTAFPGFDHDTIADVVLHVRYTARPGASSLAKTVTDNLQKEINAIENASKGSSLARLVSMRHEYPSEWHQLMAPSTGTGPRSQEFVVAKDRFPFLFAHKTITISRVELYAVPRATVALNTWTFPADLDLIVPGAAAAEPMTAGTTIGKRLRTKTLTKDVRVSAKPQDARWKFTVTAAGLDSFRGDVEDLLMVCHYRLS